MTGALLARRSVLGIAAAFGAVAAPAAAQDTVTDLLGRLAPKAAAPAQATVDVLAWAEPALGSDRTLVITLATRGDAKLVADPGISVTPLSRDGLIWAASAPTTLSVPGQTYFTAPPLLRLPFRAAAVGLVEAKVDYAYCLVERQCLFGVETVRVDLARAATPAR